MVATLNPETLSSAELVQRGRELDRTMRFAPPLATLATWRGEVALDTASIPILTDDFAPTDRLIRLGQGLRQGK